MESTINCVFDVSAVCLFWFSTS